MIKPPLSNKQCLAYRDSDARINIWQGAVRSGKTYSSILKFIKLLRTGPPGLVMVIGVTRESIQRNVIAELCNIIGCKVPSSKTNEMQVLNRHLYFVGANDESAVRRIQGSTLALAYVDEAAALPEPFWNMLLSRLSIPNAQLLSTCNPASPLHWLKSKYLDRMAELNLKTWKFVLDDNPSLTEEYKNDLKKEYTGMWYQRYILGEWAVAEGLVFEQFNDDNIVESITHNPTMRIAGIDFGMTNPTAGLLFEVNPSQWPQLHAAEEYYFDSKKELRSKSVGELADDIHKWLLPHNVSVAYLDPSAKALKIELIRRGVPVRDAKNDVLPGIQSMGRFIADKSLVVNRKCKNFINELYTYSWDTKAAEKGLDKPVKEFDHLIDCARYIIFSHFPAGTIEGMNKDNSIEAIRQRAYGNNPMADLFNDRSGYF